eukprot:scaffold197354_cov30-Tisochrysis_lutea.AAC.2
MFKVKNGDQFETLIKEKQRDNPMFSFLFEESTQAHQFYKLRVIQLQMVRRSIAMSFAGNAWAALTCLVLLHPSGTTQASCHYGSNDGFCSCFHWPTSWARGPVCAIGKFHAAVHAYISAATASAAYGASSSGPVSAASVSATSATGATATSSAVPAISTSATAAFGTTTSRRTTAAAYGT